MDHNPSNGEIIDCRKEWAIVTTTLLTPDSEPPKPGSNLVGRLLRTIALLLLVAVVSAASAYAVFEWRYQAVQASANGELGALREESLAAIAGLRAEMSQLQSALQAEMKRVDEAAQGAGLLLQKDGDLTGLQARLAEIDTLKLELKRVQEQTEAKLKGLESSLKEQVAQSEQETAQSLSIDMRVKSLVIKAQGEVLLAQVHWAEGNRGLAKDELAVAARSLQQALAEAPAAAKPGIKQVVDEAERAKAALILESSSARDSLNLLWHQVSSLLAP